MQGPAVLEKGLTGGLGSHWLGPSAFLFYPWVLVHNKPVCFPTGIRHVKIVILRWALDKWHENHKEPFSKWGSPMPGSESLQCWSNTDSWAPATLGHRENHLHRMWEANSYSFFKWVPISPPPWSLPRFTPDSCNWLIFCGFTRKLSYSQLCSQHLTQEHIADARI